MSFNYYISGYVFEVENSLEIKKTEWEKLRDAKLTITNIRYIEQKYDLMISNYIEFEKELLEQALDNSIRHINSHGIHFKYLKLARQIMNLIASTCMYMDHVKKRHVNKFPISEEEQKELMSELADYEKNNDNIRFIRNLRNYVIHRDLPLDTYNINSSWEKIENVEEKKGGSFVIPTIQKEKLITDRKFSTTVAKNFPDIKGKIDLRLPIRGSIAALSTFNDNFRGKTKKDFKSAKRLFKMAINKYRDFSESKNSFCNLIKVNKTKKVSRLHLSEKHIEQIELFYQRNWKQGILEHRYVHNRL